MKLFFLFLFMTSLVRATSLKMFKNTLEGEVFQEFVFSKEQSVLLRQTNLFDQVESLKLGRFIVKETQALKASKEIILKTLEKVKKTDALLQTKKSSFNELAGRLHHETVFILDGFRIGPKSDVYQDLEIAFRAIQTEEAKHESGVILERTYKTYFKVEKGVVKPAESFDFRFHCQEAAPPTYCLFKDVGTMFVK